MADRNAHIKISFDSDNTAYISGTSSSGITCTLSPDGYKLTFVFDRYILGGNYSNFGSYDTTNSIFTLTKPIEFLTRSATGEIVNRGEVISVSPPSQENSYTYVATIEEISKTKLDLSTLSDIADGTHTVKVKAKANGYRDSEFSNEVSYTKAPAAKYKVTFTGSYYAGDFSGGTSTSVRLNDKTIRVSSIIYENNKIKLVENGSWVEKICPYVVENVFNLNSNGSETGNFKINGVEYSGTSFTDTPYILTSDIEIQLGYYPD